METINQNLMLKEAFDYAREAKDADMLTVAKAYLDGRKRSFKVAVDLANEKTSRYMSIEQDSGGKILGIRVTAIGESFVVALKDCDKSMDWYEACKNNAPSKKQALTMAAIAKELSYLLEQVGGNRIDDGQGRWADYKCNDSNAWLYYCDDGTFVYDHSYDIHVVRSVFS